MSKRALILYPGKLILSFSIFTIGITSCEKSKNDISQLPQLNQTSWQGELSLQENGRLFRSKINIAFINDHAANYALTESSNYISEQYSQNTPITYIQDGKILKIDLGHKNILLGDWWMVEKNNDRLTLVREQQNTNETDTLTILKTK